MAGYGTDLITLTDAESGSWTELSNYNDGGAPSLDGENFIQGQDCNSQTTGVKLGDNFSIVFDNGIALSWTSGNVFLIWQYFAVAQDLEPYENGGMKIGIYSTLSDGYQYNTGGNNRSPYPYGAWQNVAVDPENTNYDVTDGAGNGGSYQYIGSLVNITLAISKGSPHAIDAIRYGRGEIFATGATCNFSGMSTYNDYNDATNGYYRFGLFRDTGGNTYLWKGLMSLGQTGGTFSVTFEDSNKTILIDDTAKTYLSFNKIVVHDTGSTVTLTNINFTALGTVSPGQFEMIDNATVTLNTCVFTDMDTFKFLSGGTINNSTFRRTNSITQSGATFTDCVFDNTNISSSGVTLYMNDVDKVTYCSFTSSGTGYAIEGFASAGDYNLYGLTFTDYAAGLTGTTGNEAVNVTATSGIVNLNIYGGGDSSFSIHSAGATVNIIAGAVTVYVKASTSGGVAIQGARVLIYAFSGGTLPYNETVTITNVGTTATVSHTGHGMDSGDKVRITGGDLTVNRGVQTITKINDNSYSYTLASAPGTSPTGTIYSTYVALEGTTDINGEISVSRVYSSNQPVKGWTRKSTTSPLYKTGNITGTIDTADGFNFISVLISDE